ncbi:putative Agenet domain, plant type [Helianthus debilis subsp. tardiflorus]
MSPTRETGVKVEVGRNNASKLRRVTVDHLHIRPSVPQTRVKSFGLLEKVDAFADFGWWSGVITKKLADSRYVVYFKHTNSAKELSHLELRPHVEWKNDVEHDELRETVSLNFTNTIEDTTTCLDKQTSIITSMKRAKPTNRGGNLKPSKKSKAAVTGDDPRLSNGGQSKEVSTLDVGQTFDQAENLSSVKKTPGKKSKAVVTADVPRLSNGGQSKEVSTPDVGQTFDQAENLSSVKKKPGKKSKAGVTGDDPRLSNDDQSKEVSTPDVGQTSVKAENLSSVKKKLGKREKGVDPKSPTSTSAKKKGKLSADSRGLETLPQAAEDSTLNTTPNVVEKKPVTINSPIPVILGLQCHNVRVLKSKKPKQLTSKSPQNVVGPNEPQSGVPLSPKATGNQEIEGGTITKKKRGRPFRTQPNNLETPLADASVKKVPSTRGIELPLQQEMYSKPVKGKRGKRRMISLNSSSSPQDVQDSSTRKEKENSEINVEKSIDTVSDDQPLSKWFHGKQSLATLESTGKKPPENSKSLPAVTNGDGQTLTFVKRSSLWETIESMEAFRVFPQKPHFRPLDDIKESARERHAINKMVDFSGVFEDTRRLRIDHPRTQIEDLLETLLELETHGFNIDFIRNRLTELISFKDKREGLESQSKEVKVNVDNHRVEVQKLDKELDSIDKQMTDLLETRDRVSKEKEKNDSEIAGLESEIDKIEEGLRECRRKFDELATASFV